MKKFKEKQLTFLKPGEFKCGHEGDVITTILGSCVAICIWHPEISMGGMSHVRLPGNRMKKRTIYNFHYSDDVIWFMIDKINNINTSPEDYIVKLFGGSSMFNSNMKLNNQSLGDVLVGNIVNRLHQNGFRIESKNIGGNFARKLYFDISNGDVWLKKYNNGLV